MMGRYLVLAPANGNDEPLFDELVEELGRLAARDASRFHVLVPRQPGGDAAVDAAASHRLAAVLDALAAGGLEADGEVGEASVLGSVARATERTHYDAVVVPVPAIGVVDALDLEVARRLYQIDVPDLQFITPGRRPGMTKADAGAAQGGDGPSRPAGERGVVIGGVLIVILAVLVAILVSHETHNAKVTAPQAVSLQVPSAGGR